MSYTDPLTEALADLEHKQWAHWTRYMLETLGLFDASEEELSSRGFDASQVENLRRWRRQIDTPYDQLTEREKDSDREWARKCITTIQG